MADPYLEAMILTVFQPGFGYYSHDIIDGCFPWTASAVRRAMTDMRRRGVIRYAEGHGYWLLPRQPAAVEAEGNA